MRTRQTQSTAATHSVHSGGESEQSGSALAWLGPGLSAAMDGRAEALCHRLSLGCEYSREIAAGPRVGVGRRTRLHAHGNRSAKRWPPHFSAVELGVGRFRHLQQIHHVATPHTMLQHPHNMLQRRTTLSRRLAACRPPGSCRVNRARLLHVAASCCRQLSLPTRHGTAHAACCMLCCMYGCVARAAAAQQRSRAAAQAEV